MHNLKDKQAAYQVELGEGDVLVDCLESRLRLHGQREDGMRSAAHLIQEYAARLFQS